MKPDYEKPWTLRGNGYGWPSFTTFFDYDERGQRFAKFGTLAPDMARALARLETANIQDETTCPACYQVQQYEDLYPNHRADCWLDGLFKQLGMTPEDRAAVRSDE